MALHWDITAIPDEVRWVDARDDDGNLIMDEETGKPQKQISPTTDALIWASMSVDMGEITKKNYQKFAERLNLIQNLDGPFMVTHTPHGTIGRRITEEDVKNNIGLSTNVYTETDAKFRKKLFRDNFKLVARVRERLELFELKQQAISRIVADNDEVDAGFIRQILDAQSVDGLFIVLDERESGPPDDNE